MLSIIVIKIKNMQKITREQFMEFFRADDFHEQLSVDDANEVFVNILHGSSDFTPELLGELESNYGVDIVKVKGQEFIDMLDTQIAVESNHELDENWTPDYKEGYIDGIKRARELFID